jgi:hypothetical protein
MHILLLYAGVCYIAVLLQEVLARVCVSNQCKLLAAFNADTHTAC